MPNLQKRLSRRSAPGYLPHTRQLPCTAAFPLRLRPLSRSVEELGDRIKDVIPSNHGIQQMGASQAPGSRVECRLWFGGARGGSECDTSNKLPVNAGAAEP